VIFGNNQENLVSQKILVLLTTSFEQALEDSHVVLSRPERQRLYRQLLADILTEIITENQT
jgi:hypothetical protein